MSVAGLGSEVVDLGQAIGLFDGNGNLQPSWFENPLQSIEAILTDDTQRAAFLRLLDALLPPVQSADIPANETWHPLLGSQPRGNAYLTVNTAAGVTFGFAGSFSSGDGTPPLATLQAHLPLVSVSGGNVSAVAGTANGPLAVSLRVHLGLNYPADPIGLDAVVVSISLAPLGSPDPNLSVTLEGLQLDASGPQDVLLDPSNLGSEAVHLILGFIREQLSRVAGPTGEAAAVVNHLLPLLGFGTDGIPPFPFAQLSTPGALNSWFSSLLAGPGTPPIVAWLGHLVGLLGSSDLTIAGTGTVADPWVAPILPLGTASGSGLGITLASQTVSSTTTLLLGLQALVIPDGAAPAVRIEASAVLAAIPITGTGKASVLPSASVTAVAPGALGAGALVSTPTITVQSVEAGFSWANGALQPLLQLEAVDLTLLGTTTHYPQVDLTNADSVASAASSLIGSTLAGYLGTTGPGRNLAALIGLVPPEGDLASPHSLDLTQLVSNPAAAIAAVHRAVLLDSTHGWSHMLEEIGGLVGITTAAVTGSGTRSDPWVLSLAPASFFLVEIAAWNDQTSSLATDPQKLRLGLRASAAQAPVTFYWLAELLAFDLPPSGSGTVSLMAGQHVHLQVQPLPTIPDVAGFTLSIADLFADLTWIPGSAPAWTAGLQDLSLTYAGSTIHVPSIAFPLAAPFDVSSPAAVAADFGLTIPELEQLLRLILARALYSWGGVPAFTLAGLLGVHGALDGLPADWPTLADPSGPGSLLSDPFTGLRNWVNAIATGASADGYGYLPQLLPTLRALLADALPAAPGGPLPAFSLPISGSGTYDDPWALPLTTTATSSVDALLWLEPAGPPSGWATPLITAATGAADFLTLLSVAESLAGFLPALSDGLANSDAGVLASALGSLASFFATGDGVVPLASQVPTSAGWTAGITLESAHSAQPSDPAAIAQILARIDTLAGGAIGARTVLLLGPAFSDHSAWATLLADPTLHGTTAANTNFNLRVPGLDPSVVDLTTVTAKADYYTADLYDDGTGNLVSLSAQIARLVARIQQLNGSTPVTLVAHSTAGLAARAFTVANSTLVQGLITLGTPHLGSPLPFLADNRIADALRVVQLLRPQLAAGPTRDALDFLVQMLDGYLPPATAGALPLAAPFLAGSFPAPTPAPSAIDSGGRPVLALGGQLASPLLDTLKPALAALATSAASPATAPAAPTHLAFGARAHINLATTTAGNAAVDTTIRGDLFQLALASGAPAPPHPAHALHVRATLTNPNGWLVGASSAVAASDVRIRWAEIGADISIGTSGVQVHPVVDLHQVSWHGPVSALASYGDANTQALLGAILQTISTPAPAATSSAGILLATLQALDIAVVDSHGGIGISADAYSAIAADAAGYLGPKLTAALSAGTAFAGFTATTAIIPGRGATAIPEWVLPIGTLPLEVYLAPGSLGGWTLGLRTTAPGGATVTTPGTTGWSIAGNTTLNFDANVTTPTFTPVLDASFTLGAFTLAYDSSTGQLTVRATPWLAPFTLIPAPTASTLEAALTTTLPRLLFSGAASAALEAVAGPGLQIGPIDTFFTDMASVLTRATALGNSTGTGLSSARLTTLLQLIGSLASLPAGPGLSLPGDLQVTASGAGTTADPVTVQLATTAPIGGVLTLSGGVAFDSLLHPSPTGALAFTIPLPAVWTSLTVNFGVSAAGVTLSLTPTSTPATAPIQILPTFSGLGALAGTAEALLPQVLDATVTAIGPATISTLTLDIATALGIYDSVGHFSAHADELKAMLGGSWLSGFTAAQRSSIATAIAGLFSGGSPLAGTLPGTVTAGSGPTAGLVTWALPLSGGDTGTVLITLGWDATGPAATVGVASLKLADGALAITASAGYAAGSIAVSAGLGLSLQQALGLAIVPTLSLTESGGAFQLEFYPLATGGSGSSANGPITIDFIPPAIHLGAGGPVALVEQLLLPLVADTLFAAFEDKLTTPLWTGGPQLQAVLTGSGIAVPSGATVILNPVFPNITALVTGLLTSLAQGTTLAITSTLNLVLANKGGRLGVLIQGSESFDIGEYTLSMLFGAPTSWGSTFDAGIAVYLFNASGSSFTFNPGIVAAGLGLGLTGQDDAPLVDTGGFRIGGVNLYSFFEAEFASGFSFSSPGAGAEITKLGLPLSQATGGNVGGNNPVAASLIGGGGDGGNGSGDTQPVNPGIDVSAWYWAAPAGDSTFHILFEGNDSPIWIGIHAQLGPIYLDQIGILLNGNTSASLVLDATVKVGPLTGQVDELGVTIPFKSLMHPGDWSLDLQGLALSFQTPGITIAGALLKNDSGGTVEYDGMLLIEITEFGLVAVGAYSKPHDATGDYTSVFIFAGLFIIIGIPPIIEVEAIGLGVGYNRELIVPTDLNAIPSFILVAALDDGGALANDPMGELMQIRDSIPAKRGSFWFAVGLHGTTFVIVHVTAIVYIALDRGLEIGILGVARLAIPSDDTALVSLELALKARFSSAEGILSIQAQLTDNSYLFDKDCQLTGGFAYFMWFPEGQFVLSIGGYNPNFVKPTQFPDVPRLGFNWGLPIGATIKGGCYFALTNTCIMAGGSLELTYGISCAYVWFTAYCDFLISWDPFYYSIDLGVSVGATFSLQVCFWGFCIGVSITVSLGASLMIAGPPLHGTVTVDLAICSITVAFGDNPNPQPPYITDFTVFATKYLYGGKAGGNAFQVNVLSGLIPPAPSGASPAPGTSDKPWQMISEFSFQLDTKMPATITNDFVFGDQDKSGEVHSIDLAPMNIESVSTKLVVTLWGSKDGVNWTQISVAHPSPDQDFQIDTLHWKMTPIVGKVSEATWHWVDPSNIPAAANTLPAVVGLKIEGFCVFEGKSALIPIAKLYDTGNSRPLPFATGFTLDFPIYVGYGNAAVLLGEVTSLATSGNTYAIASSILSGSGFFANQRVLAGLSPGGISPVANRALLYRRSAPPMIAPITTGLTMQPPALPVPPVIASVPPVLPVVLAQPRLRAVLRGQPQVVSDAPSALRTSVSTVAAAAGVARTAAPLADALGARLVRVKAPSAPAATRIAKAAYTLGSAELGWASGTGHQAEITNALANLQGGGLTLPAGTTHIWDIPAGVAEEFVINGNAAFRITFLTRGGSVIEDREYPASDQTTIPIPARCGMVSVACLGNVPAASDKVAPGFGAVAFTAAPSGKQPVAGWQAGNLLPQVGPTTILGRGACLILPQTYIPLRSRQAISQTMVRVTDAVAAQPGTETWLPSATSVVMILLDLQDPSAAADGDLALSAQGATLAASPIRILGGRRRALLYDLNPATPAPDHITIGVASLTGWRVAGVVGMAGRAQEWATSLQGKVPEHIVPDGPLTPDGIISVRLVAIPAAPALQKGQA